MKKLISLLLSIVLMFRVSAEAFAAYAEDRAKVYDTKRVGQLSANTDVGYQQRQRDRAKLGIEVRRFG